MDDTCPYCGHEWEPAELPPDLAASKQRVEDMIKANGERVECQSACKFDP